MNSEIHPNAAPLIPLVEGIVKLFYPYVEGAVHDLRKGKVVALYNNISKRKVGDPSAVTELGINPVDFPDVFDPYYKTNWDGRRLKCISVTIRDNDGAPVGLVCINFDISVFESMGTQLEQILALFNKDGLNPVEQFADNWQQQVSDFIDGYAQTHGIAIWAMTKEQKSALVNEMYDHSLFNYRDAATHVARKLGVSRTTIYNYLKEGKK